MTRTLVYDREAFDQLNALPEKPRLAMMEALERYAETGVGHVRFVVSSRPRTYRLRDGDYRALLLFEHGCVVVKSVRLKNEDTYK